MPKLNAHSAAMLAAGLPQISAETYAMMALGRDVQDADEERVGNEIWSAAAAIRKMRFKELGLLEQPDVVDADDGCEE